MVESEQRRELGEQWFHQLQEEIDAASAESLEAFRAAINPDAMGFEGQEGIDDED